jgi:hypothetical protein
METLSGAASISTLLDLTVKLTQSLARFRRDFIDGPKQLATISTRLDFLRRLLQAVQNIKDTVTVDSRQLQEHDWDILSHALHTTSTAVVEIQKAIDRYNPITKRTARLKWAMLGKKTSDDLLNVLQSAEIDLLPALDLFQWFVVFSFDQRSAPAK